MGTVTIPYFIAILNDTVDGLMNSALWSELKFFMKTTQNHVRCGQCDQLFPASWLDSKESGACKYGLKPFCSNKCKVVYVAKLHDIPLPGFDSSIGITVVPT